jgi:hypothetical protein
MPAGCRAVERLRKISQQLAVVAKCLVDAADQVVDV